MARALLLFNPHASGVSPRVRDVIAHALSDVVPLDVCGSKRRGHATEIAATAAAAGTDFVFVLGGDGTVNEAINGLAGSDTVLAIVPAGGTNVLARTLGLPRDPVEATGLHIERLRDERQPTPLTLGDLNGRLFAFCAGIGFDADVVREVHRREAKKKRFGELYFMTTALRTFFMKTERHDAALTVRSGDHEIADVHALIACNSDPYAFFGARPLRLAPRAMIDGGIDLTLLHSMKARHVIGIAARALYRGGSHIKRSHITALHDQPAFTVTSTRPIAHQTDGEYLGEETTFTFALRRDAIRVLA